VGRLLEALRQIQADGSEASRGIEAGGEEGGVPSAPQGGWLACLTSTTRAKRVRHCVAQAVAVTTPRHYLPCGKLAREYIRVEQNAGAWRVDLGAPDRTVGSLAENYYVPCSFCLHRLPVAAAL
jgi:hypothetical protein